MPVRHDSIFSSDVRTENGNLHVYSTPSVAYLDAFSRQRFSEPFTLFDSKQIFDNQPLYWDDVELSGCGTSSSWSGCSATTYLRTSASVGARARQTYQSFNYQPGKSMMVIMTTNFSGSQEDVSKRIGYFNASNGLFLELSGSEFSFNIRTQSNGVNIVTTSSPQSEWNIDKLDGTGKSRKVLSKESSQIFFMDFEWLGVGSVAFGFFIDREPIYCHFAHNANSGSTVYMSTPNLPLRYEISSSNTSSSAEFQHICSTVISEGGQDKNGVVRYSGTDGTHLSAATSGSKYALLGMRLKSNHIGAMVKPISINVFSTTNDDFEWMLLLSPTIAGSFQNNYVDEPNSAVQIARGTTDHVVSASNIALLGGYGVQSSVISQEIETAIALGACINGGAQEMVLCVRPLGSNASIHGGWARRELQ